LLTYPIPLPPLTDLLTYPIHDLPTYPTPLPTHRQICLPTLYSRVADLPYTPLPPLTSPPPNLPTYPIHLPTKTDLLTYPIQLPTRGHLAPTLYLPYTVARRTSVPGFYHTTKSNLLTYPTPTPEEAYSRLPYSYPIPPQQREFADLPYTRLSMAT
jgi:hypothetical protein